MEERTQIEVKTDGFPFYFDAEELAQALQAWFGSDPKNFVEPARMMIEAQNLLAAAEGAFFQFEHNGSEADSDKEVLDHLRAAIDKAKGEA